MELRELIRPEHITLNLVARDKEAVLRELLALLVASGELDAQKVDGIVTILMDRESKISTGMQRGLAMPHCKAPDLEYLLCAIGICKEGLDFDSLDGEPSRLFILLVSPELMSAEHIGCLSNAGKLLHEKGRIEKMITAKSRDELVQQLSCHKDQSSD